MTPDQIMAWSLAIAAAAFLVIALAGFIGFIAALVMFFKIWNEEFKPDKKDKD